MTYQVIAVGRMWRVIDRSRGGKVVAFRQSYKEALELAKSWDLSRKMTREMLAA